MAGERPSGTVTFLFTDIEGSTRLWEEHPEHMAAALARHDAMLRSAIEGHGGYVFSTAGDSFAAAFDRPEEAVGAAIAAQRDLAAEAFPGGLDIRVRMGVHAGTADERGGDYFGPTPTRAARIMGAAHGGQVLVSGSAAPLLRTTFELEDLGSHRLRDLTTSEPLHQLVAEGLRASFGPVRSLDAYASNLPAQVSTFVGRDREIDRIEELTGQARLVTITGVGGVGKTRLALHAAAELLPKYSGGVWLVELADVVDAGEIPQTIAEAIGLDGAGGQATLRQISERLQARPTMLILDNCEHVLDPIGRIAEDLLRVAPTLGVVATSREGLGLAGERILPLRSLTVPDPDSEEVLASEAAQLFVDRALASDPSLELDMASLAAIGEICRRLDGIALAIELAAARASALSPLEIADRLDQRFRLLTGRRSNMLERHQTLRATVDWSFELLDDGERRCLAESSVFAGGFDIDAAQAVVGGDELDDFEVVDAVQGLVQKSLLVADRRGGRSRYRALETIRQYGMEKLDATDDPDGPRRRHQRYFAELTGAIADGLQSREEGVWRARFDTDLDNIRAAVHHALSRDGVEDACRVVAPLLPTMFALDALHTQLAEIALDGHAPEDTVAQLEAAGLAVWNAALGNDEPRAVELAEMIEAAGDESAFSPALLRAVSTGNDFGGSRDILEARARRANELAQDGDDDYEKCVSLGYYLYAQLMNGRPTDQLVALAEESLELARRLENPTELAIRTIDLAWVLETSDPRRALALARDAYRIADEVNHRFGRSLCSTYIGRALHELGEDQAILSQLIPEITAAFGSGNYGYANYALMWLMPALAAHGHVELAATIWGHLHGTALAIVTAPVNQSALDRARALIEQGLAEADRERLEAAGSALGQASLLERVEAAASSIEGSVV